MLEENNALRQLPVDQRRGKLSGERIRVMLVVGYPMLRERMKRLFEGEGRFEVVGDVDSVEDALEELKQRKAEMVVMDIRLPGLDGVEGIRLFKAKHPKMKVVIVGLDYLVPSVEAGADGYLPKILPSGELVESMHRAAPGISPADSALTRHPMNHATAERGRERNGMPTERQQEVLRLVANGLSSKELASRLHISQTTLSREIRNIYNLLRVNNRAHAVAEAYRRSLI